MTRNKKLYSLIILSIMLCLSYTVAQNVEDLRHDKEQAESQLLQTNRALQRNLKSARSMIYELELLNAEIRDQNALIDTLNREVSRLNRQQRIMQDSIDILQNELNEKINSYATAIRNMGRRRTQYDELIFIFSANSFAQSIRRMRYLKEYSRWRRNQAEEIVAQRAELESRKVALDTLIAQRQSVIAERNTVTSQLREQQSDKKAFVKRLGSEEKSLRAEAERQRRRINQLNAQIDHIIAEEARKAAERARAEAEAEAARQAALRAQSDSTTTTTPSTPPTQPVATVSTEGFTMTRADRELSGSFEKNKGKLPFPISGQYRIVGHFGLQKHPEFKYLDKNNLGIDIETTPGNKARAVFEGEVARVFSFGGAEKAVMIRHGNYYTVYTGLIEVYVKAGDKVAIRQELGLIYSDPNDNNRTRLSFQIRKDMEKLDPEKWLDL